ncbi:choline kinase [Arcobacter sp. CECT 8989]|uniref:choline/ethanolamine kinase family protein n=1 Tax=Arcobacter sp. CECT 8989 TaxID=2044509 RepID=UPI00100BA357|nr:choline/ethanolamine kinase family protein [Arcobacter sp. CECT 8989]RXK01856.1 choline kinase [Arcobacter sp. CECT 8989]
MTKKQLQQHNIFENEKLLSFKLLKNQGFCNINYLLKTSKKRYLVRVFKNDSTVNISREFEFKVQKKAFKKGIAGRPQFLDNNKTFMVCEYLNGVHKYKLSKKELKNLVKTIKKLHSIKVQTKKLNLKEELKKYNHLSSKKAKKSILALNKEIKNLTAYKKQLVCSHHDLNPKNIIFNKNRIKFIDWEYTSISDCFFDLATICCEFDLTKKEERILLKTYFRKIVKKDIKKLDCYKNIYNQICKLWFISLEYNQGIKCQKN